MDRIIRRTAGAVAGSSPLTGPPAGLYSPVATPAAPLNVSRGFFFGRLRENIHKVGGLGGAMDFDLQTYYPVLLYLAVVLLFAAANLVATHVIGPRHRTPIKLMPY